MFRTKTVQTIKDICDVRYIYFVHLLYTECPRRNGQSVPYIKIYRYNPKHLYPKLNGYGDNDQRSLKL